MQSLRYFILQSIYNIKNAHALKRSFWIGVGSMILNNLTFFIIWFLFMKATGPINGWSSLDVFGMLGVALVAFGFCHSFFYGIVDLPKFVLRGSFDSILLSPASTLLKLASSSFSVTAYGDLLQGIIVSILYGILSDFSLFSWLLFLVTIVLACTIFISVRLLCSLIVFYIHDGEVISGQVFEIFLRPGLYPGAIFPNKLKLFFMTIIPALLTSATPIDIIKLQSSELLLITFLVTIFWVAFTYLIFSGAIRRYESGNYLR